MSVLIAINSSANGSRSPQKITMAPYSLSACQVVRVFCAVLRALGASPIMSLGIVFLAGYPTVKLLCNANTHSVFSLPFSYLTSDVHLKEVCCSDMGARPRPLYFASQNILDYRDAQLRAPCFPKQFWNFDRDAQLHAPLDS